MVEEKNRRMHVKALQTTDPLYIIITIVVVTAMMTHCVNKTLRLSFLHSSTQQLTNV